MVTDPVTRFKHAFVTGATGIVGVPLCRHLVKMGVEVTAYSRNTGDFGLPDEVDHVEGDVLDGAGLADAVQGTDVVFHLAAAVHGSASTYSDFERVNVTGTENVVLATRHAGAKLVHVSSVNVDGFRRGQLADAYASTKSRAEELVLEAVENGLDAVIIRPATVFGSEAGRAGLIVGRLLSGSLKILPAPTRKISPVWSADLATALVGAAQVGESGRTYTVAGPTMTTGEFVRAICDSGGLKKPLVSIPAWVFAVPLQMAWWGRGLTRWTPPVSVESMLHGSTHDGGDAADRLGFGYTALSEIFG